MKCPRCGTESRIGEKDKFCYECGFPLNVSLGSDSSEELKSFFLDVKLGVVLVNGSPLKYVTAFSLRFENGKYGLLLSNDKYFKANAPLSIERGVSSQVLEANGA